MSYRPLSEEEMKRCSFLQYRMIKELEPIMRPYFSVDMPVGAVACYLTMSKLKVMYAEALRTMTKDKDMFDEAIADMDREMTNDNPIKEARPFLEAMSKLLLHGDGNNE